MNQQHILNEQAWEQFASDNRSFHHCVTGGRWSECPEQFERPIRYPCTVVFECVHSLQERSSIEYTFVYPPEKVFIVAECESDSYSYPYITECRKRGTYDEALELAVTVAVDHHGDRYEKCSESRVEEIRYSLKSDEYYARGTWAVCVKEVS